MTQTATNHHAQAAAVTPQALESLQKLRVSLHESAAAAMNAKDTYMHGVYTELLAVVSRKVIKAQARMAREQVATHRRDHKSLRKLNQAQSMNDDIENS